MPDKFQNRYRIPSARAQWWDYGREGLYFITICTQDREHSFGKIVDGVMHLSHTGVIADILWWEIKNHFPFVELHEFVVMPNHIHGIVYINNDGRDIDSTTKNDNPDTTPGRLRFRNQGKNTLSSIIGSYKSAVTKHARRLGYSFAWQPRFHDRIMRDNNALNNISDYIRNNPARWREDDFFG